MKRTAATALVLALSVWGGGAHAQIQGPMREQLIAAMENICKARSASQQVLSPEMSSALCECGINYAMDRVTADQLVRSSADFRRGETPPWLTKLSIDAAAYCLTNLSKQYSSAQPLRKRGHAEASQDAGVSTYVVPVDKGPAVGVPTAPTRPEECSSYVLKVVTDPSQSVCSRK
ncbi:hypothetical protein [Phenylobacterium montanum]|uniref:Secreted protein n=1 Tax=Phenylobacterium montanum TaxID=2823693 RepID=A0A975G348_9CAUL|nr:hypothetical protein [Caulobacter sp. S6]QUD90010.1 hypothetical protein KCG34_09165 [Caulobacter sp. S6]